jgi:DNA-binding NarL/FixJ family response regulator
MCLSPVRVLIVDDSAAFAEALGESLATEPCLEIVGIANGVASGLDLLRQRPIDLVISDVGMPDGGLASLMLAMAAIDGIVQPKVIAMSGNVHGSTVVAQAFGVPLMDKQAGRASFLVCIDAMLCGECF